MLGEQKQESQEFESAESKQKVSPLLLIRRRRLAEVPEASELRHLG